MPATALSHRVRVLAAPGARHDEILTPAALDFVGRLTAAFAGRRQALLRERRRQARRLAHGVPLDFPAVTSAVRADRAWRVADPAPGLEDRRVELVGPPDRRTAARALASGANAWVADFEGGTSPTWTNLVGGQLTLLDAAEAQELLGIPPGHRPRHRAHRDRHRRLVRTCHRRGAHAIGGMSAQVPGGGPGSGASALAAVRLDKEREAQDGFDGTSAAHLGLVPLCREVFDAALGDRPHRLDRARDDVRVDAAGLLSVRRTGTPPAGRSVRAHVTVALRYFAAWLRGEGSVELDGFVEDASTAEIARVRTWQWPRHRMVERDTVLRLLDEELDALGATYPFAPLDDLRDLFERTALAAELPAYFTPDAYARHLVRRA